MQSQPQSTMPTRRYSAIEARIVSIHLITERALNDWV